MKYNIEHKNEQIYITIIIESAGTAGKPKKRTQIRKQDVLNILNSEKITPGRCIRDAGILNNFSGGPLEKTWVFEKISKPKPKAKPKTRSKRPSGRKKSSYSRKK
jgi:hypothetical protein